MTSLPACLRLARTEQVGPRTWRKLVDKYGSAAEALEALPYLPVRGRNQPVIPPMDVVMREIDATLQMGGCFLTLFDADYPAFLRQIPDAPPVLSVLGDVSCLSRAGVSIVGARNASAQGMRLAESLATELVEAELTVISGLARGIDKAAHKGALHRQGCTIAAIAGGLDCPYPPENASLQAEIAQKGAVVTEAPLGTAPLARHFPRRNRLIAGLGLGCVVVEAAPHSGTLITARMVVDYGRELFAVPGSPLDPRCRGSNNLLRNGAILTESVADILPHLPPVIPLPAGSTASLSSVSAPRQKKSASPAQTGLPFVSDPPEPTFFASPQNVDEKEPIPLKPHFSAASTAQDVRENLLSLLSFTPIAVDDLIRRCQFSASAVLVALTELELSGCVSTYSGGMVGLADNQAETAG